LKTAWTFIQEDFLPTIYSVTEVTYDCLISFGSLPITKKVATDVYSGFVRVFDPNNIPELLAIKNVPTILRQSFVENAPALALYLGAEFASHQARYYLPNNLVVNYSLNLFDGTAHLLFSAAALRGLYRNSILNLTMARTVAGRVEEEKCGCNDEALIKAELFSPLDYFMRMVSLRAASDLPIICYIAPIAEILNHGRNLLEYRYGMRKCSEHRMQDLTKYNAYAFGLGLHFYFSCDLIVRIINRYTAANQFILSQAIYAAMYPWFVAVVLLKAPISNRQGYDFFYYHRYLTGHLLAQAENYLINFLNNPQKKFNWEEFIQSLKNNKFLQPLTNYLSSITETNLVSWLEDFFSDETHALLFDVYYDQIKDNLKTIVKLQTPLRKQGITEMPRAAVISAVATLPGYLSWPFISKKDKTLLNMVRQKLLRDPVKSIDELLAQLRIAQQNRREIAKVKVKKINRYSFLARALNQIDADENKLTDEKIKNNYFPPVKVEDPDWVQVAQDDDWNFVPNMGR